MLERILKTEIAANYKRIEDPFGREYLKEVSPIEVFLWSMKHEGERPIDPFLPGEGAQDVNIYERRIYDPIRGMRGDKKESYRISPINKKDKMSRWYRNCLGLVAVGLSKERGHQISFLSHQDPKKVLPGRDAFLRDLGESLKKLKRESRDSTIDVMIFGGNYVVDKRGEVFDPESYEKFVKMSEKVIKEVLGFGPFALEPKDNPLCETVYFRTNTRKLFVLEIVAPGKYPPVERGLYKTENLEEKKKEWISSRQKSGTGILG